MNDNKTALTKKEFDILNLLSSTSTPMPQRSIASSTGISVGMVNKIINEFEKNGYIQNSVITSKGLEALEPYKARRAIIIAAGFGSRLVPITLNTPKPLVRIKGKRIIDSIIDAVIAAGIEDIVIVRGYLGEQFDQLLYKYPNIRFVENPIYNEANNISSVECIRYLLGNSYVIEADLWLRNPSLITKYQYCSNYIGVPTERTDDWCFYVDNNGYIKKLSVGGENCYHMFGISYWNEEDGKRLSEDIEAAFRAPGGKELYWDQVALGSQIDKYNIAARQCTFDDITEIDTFNELKKLDPSYRV